MWLKNGESEWDAKLFVLPDVLGTLEFGKSYETKDIINPIWRLTSLKNFPKKVQVVR